MRVANSIGRASLVAATALLAAAAAVVAAKVGAAAPGSDPWTAAELITPETLVKELWD